MARCVLMAHHLRMRGVQRLNVTRNQAAMEQNLIGADGRHQVTGFDSQVRRQNTSADRQGALAKARKWPNPGKRRDPFAQDQCERFGVGRPTGAGRTDVARLCSLPDESTPHGHLGAGRTEEPQPWSSRTRPPGVAMEKRIVRFDEKDVRIQWYSGTGAGGQYRNKHQNSCRVVHMPTGIQAIGTKNRERAPNLRDAMAALERRFAESLEVDKERRRDQGVVRTYHFERNEVIDYATGLRAPVGSVLDGDLDIFAMHLLRGSRPRLTGRA